ncbi:MAG TPA: lysylphosphatidylglycerol synthase transmembrane domain-containing protein [Pyrinomonadaceae bacterium]
MKTSSYRKYVEFGGLCLLAVGLLWWFGRKLDWAEVRRTVSHANPYFLGLAILLISIAYLFRARRWGALLKPLTPSRASDLFIATTIGFGAVFLVGRAGEVVRPVVLPMRDPRVRPSASFVTIMVERIYDIVAIVLLFAVNLIWFRPSGALVGDFGRVRTAGVVLLAGAVVGVAGLAWFRKSSDRIIDGIRRLLCSWSFIPKRISKLVVRLLEQLARALRVLVNLRELTETIGWTALLWFGITIANLLVIRAFGLNFGISETVFVLGWALAGSVVPTPGGAAGAFHAATAAGFLFLGVERDTAAAISIVMHIVDFGPALLFGLFFLIRGDLDLTKLRTLVSSESVEHAVEDESIGDQIVRRVQPETAGD